MEATAPVELVSCPVNNSYWNKNIEEWGRFYLGTSHSDETLNGPQWFSDIYKKSIGRHEARLMGIRYALTRDFIRRRVTTGTTAVDVGCGTGVLTLELLKSGAQVIAVDFAPRALELTQELVAREIPEGENRLTVRRLDIQAEAIPECDLFLAMGVTPYLPSMETFFQNTLPSSSLGLVSFVNQRHWANQLRTKVSALNVRDLQFFNSAEVNALWAQHRFQVVTSTRLGTGYVQEAQRIRA